MSLRTALYSHLSTDGTLTAVRGTRVYTDMAPTSAQLPYQVFFKIDKVGEDYLLGHSGLATDRWQINSYAATRIAADDLAIKTRDSLIVIQGTMGSGANTADVARIFWDDGPDSTEGPSDGSQAVIYVARTDFLITYHETAVLLS